MSTGSRTAATAAPWERGSLSTEPAAGVELGREVAEAMRPGPAPLWRHPEWHERFPWLVQGTTGSGDAEEPFDLGVYGEVPTGALMERWATLLEATGMDTAVHSRQVHEARIAEWNDALPPGVVHVDGFDGHVTQLPGLLLSVSVADCVPVFLVAERERAVGLVHAGWRGVAASIVEGAIDRLAERGIDRATVWLHCGPCICGVCYEVGPEVHAGVSPDVQPPSSPTPIDLRAAIARRAVAAGLAADRITRSTHCTRCGPGEFFSHRGGSAARQMGVLGIRG